MIKKVIYSAILITILGCYEKKIENKWILRAIDNNTTYIECPEVIEFKKGFYTIYNDCYGNAVNPIIEKGQYTIKGNTLVLSQRDFVTESNYSFITRNTSLILEIISLGDTLTIENQLNNKKEKYKFLKL